MSNTTWFTADLHLGHSRIIEYCTRPFKDHEEMEDQLLENFNSVVNPGDSIYFLGDLCWSTYNLKTSKFLNELKARQRYLVLGNHDNKKSSEYLAGGFCWVGDYKKLSFQGGALQVVLCHYPFRTWQSKQHGSYQLFGHVHGRLEGEGRSMDVGVDPLNFFPISLEEVVERLKGREFRKDEP